MITEKFFTDLENAFADYFESGCSPEKRKEIESLIENRPVFEGMTVEQIETENERDLKEIANFYGGWEQLARLVKELWRNEEEAAYDRAYDPERQ